MRDYFDKMCASKESQLSAESSEVVDNDTVKEIRQQLDEHPDDGNLLIQFGDALSYQLRYLEAVTAYTKAIQRMPESTVAYQKRAGRHLTTLQVEKAYKDYQAYKNLGGDDVEIELLMGITAYLDGQYQLSKNHFEEWITISSQDTEELVAVFYWYAICCIQDNDTVTLNRILSYYSSDMFVGHHTAYQCGIELFCGNISSTEALDFAEKAEGDDRDLEYSMVVYAVAKNEERFGNTKRYIELLDRILMRDTFWAGFACLAAWNDRFQSEQRNRWSCRQSCYDTLDRDNSGH